jgi:tetratricopeptide (TPR) repeat protein
MYHRSVGSRSAPVQADEPAGADPPDFARLVVDRVRMALTAFNPGMPFDPARYRAALTTPAASVPEEERLFALGWLQWLDGNWTAAEPLFADVADRARAANNIDLLAESSYWRARVGLLLGRVDAIAMYEAVLRTPDISPRATAWFVDLLWRAGRIVRAEQILKTVRGNRRFAACDEVPLLESRSALHRGDLSAGERLLSEAAPAGCVAQAERWLLLAWVAASQNKHSEAADRLERARHCLYPAPTLEAWQRALARRAGAKNAPASIPASAVCADFIRGQEHRVSGNNQEAVAAYRTALEGPAAPFARYALARMGEGDFETLLASRPGLFLALRCRAQIVLRRFLRREASPAECLDALQVAATVGHGGDAANHFRTIATALRRRSPEPTALRELAATQATEPAARRNFLRAAVEVASRRLPPADAALLLSELRSLASEVLRAPIERQILRQRLLAAVESDARENLPALVESLLTAAGAGEVPPHAKSLWSAARAPGTGTTGDVWRAPLKELPARWQPLARSLLLWEAAARGDGSAVTVLLDDADAWRGFGARPPRFAVAAIEYVVATRPSQPVPEQALSRWLALWPGIVSEALAARAMSGRGPVPQGMSPGPWYLHQASRALARDDYREAEACVGAALGAGVPAESVAVVEAAQPELERYAEAQHLAEAFRSDGLAAVSAALLVDAVDLLHDLPGETGLLSAVSRNDRQAIDAALAALFERPELPPRLAHHLALLEHRRATFLDTEGQTAEAVAAHRRARGWWLRLLAAGPPDGPESGPAGVLADCLLGGHRRSVNAMLGRGAVEGARLHWELVAELPALAARLAPARAEELAALVASFRDELATDFLIATREAMRQAPSTEDSHAHFDSGLARLRQLLSLDRDNPRLLTALLEICGVWFFNLYNAGTRTALIEQVERFTPFALQLARQVDGRPGDLAARAALATFTKFRGYVAADPVRRAELYREALRFNPTDNNVRGLLANLERTERGPGE